METENFAPLDLEKEYYKTLRASRIVATVLLLLTGAWAAKQCAGVPQFIEIFEDMVTGGLRGVPSLTRLVSAHYMEALGLVCFAALVAVFYIWLAARSLSRVILVTVVGVVLCLLVGLIVQMAMGQPLQTIITKFNG